MIKNRRGTDRRFPTAEAKPSKGDGRRGVAKGRGQANRGEVQPYEPGHDSDFEAGHDSDFEVKAKKVQLAAAEEDILHLKAKVCVKLHIVHTGVSYPPQPPPSSRLPHNPPPQNPVTHPPPRCVPFALSFKFKLDDATKAGKWDAVTALAAQVCKLTPRALSRDQGVIATAHCSTLLFSFA